MSDRLIRAVPADLEVRGDGRTVVGLAVPFDRPTEIADWSGRYREVFRKGAFARTIAERGPSRVKIHVQHRAEDLPIGRATVLREDPAGLYLEARISPTPTGDEVLTLVKDGTLDGLSIAFVPKRDRWSPDRSSVERLEVALREISVVGAQAYSDAVITGVRAASGPAIRPDRDPLLLRRLFPGASLL